MKKVLFVLLSLMLVSCSGGNDNKANASAAVKGVSTSQAGQQTHIFQAVEPDQAEQLIRTKKDLLILDVRNPPELKEGKIKDSVLAPFWSIAKGNYQVPTDRPILVVCAVGGRSYAVGQLLNKKGYNEVYNLSGGMVAWKQAGKPVVY